MQENVMSDVLADAIKEIPKGPHRCTGVASRAMKEGPFKTL